MLHSSIYTHPISKNSLFGPAGARGDEKQPKHIQVEVALLSLAPTTLSILAADIESDGRIKQSVQMFRIEQLNNFKDSEKSLYILSATAIIVGIQP